jgi:hypothetical protein
VWGFTSTPAICLRGMVLGHRNFNSLVLVRGCQ